MRHSDDTTWGAGCSQARRGNWSTDFVNLVNSRFLEDAESIDLFHNVDMRDRFPTVRSCLKGIRYTPVIAPLLQRELQ